MNKEDLIAMGLTEEQAKKVMDSLDGNFVTKARFNEINEENKTLKKSVSDRDKQLEDLKKSSGDNAALQQQISDLQKQNADQQKAHDEELAKLKLDNAVEIALSGAKARNGKAVKAMLDMSKVKLGEDGKLSGFDEQIEALKKSDAYMFDVQQQQTQQQFTGFQPGASSTVPNSTAAGYEARLADARKNNNQLEVIKIKQEAAADGVVLM
jgi:phage minor structural protein GP20